MRRSNDGKHTDFNDRPLKLVFAICLFLLMSFLVYPYLIASIYRLDFSWPSVGNPVQLTLEMLNRPLPALAVCMLVFPTLGLTVKQKIRYFENKDI
jgi:hypothetical protein